MIPAAASAAGVTLVDVVQQVLRRGSSRLCVSDPASGVEWSYGDVHSIVNAWWSRFDALGLQPTDGIAVLAGNRAELVAAMLAILGGGYRYTPLHAKSSLDDLAYVIADCEARAVIFDAATSAAVVAALRERVPDVLFVELDAPRGMELAPPRAQVAESDIAMLPYTGGTTGLPKGVMQSQRCVVHCLLSQLAEWPWPTTPRLACVTPLSHGGRHLLLPTLWRGGSVTTLSPSGHGTIGSLLAASDANCVFLVPSIMYELLDETPRPDLGQLELILYGASAIDPARLRDAIREWGGRLVQLYGQTEAPNILASLSAQDHDLRRPHLLASCGRPSLGVKLTIRNDADERVPNGSIGEICVQSRLTADGYWKRPDETAETFHRNGWLRTGDLGFVDDAGYLYVVDRRKDMIITGGVNVFSAEVELAIREHPAVSDVAVVGTPDPRWGEAVTAFVVANTTVEVDELRLFVRERKGPVHAPKRIEFVDSLPMTHLGKPDKRALRDRYASGAVEEPAQ